MQKKNLVAFDFDGTLYPIIPYDSEQRLILTNAKERGHLNRLRAKRMVKKDREGRMAHGEFNQRYLDLLGGCTPSQVDQVARDLSSLVDPSQFLLLEELSRHAELAILSCGTENIIHSFLAQHGIDHHFFMVSGKNLEFSSKGSKPSMVCSIASPEQKRAVFADLKRGYSHAIAVGDGPTDIPMLEQADLGLIIDWKAEPVRYPFETYTDLTSTLKRCLSYLESAT
ncbi:HAD family hydrolase [Sphaerochaeta sp. PS]|uniref:HAD family hydrolase n=1 Tax=Sphaerochaeta sp. PS TaxID=3076336 RepID=UPI0028A380BE|nr:HAD family hydrolase [Sphaerochaeta sp. PS]MDT4762891.1 HAD family hydrolase [Sphaerochaeta sp. PS]